MESKSQKLRRKANRIIILKGKTDMQALNHIQEKLTFQSILQAGTYYQDNRWKTVD